MKTTTDINEISKWTKAAESLGILAHPDRLRLLDVLQKTETSAVGNLAQTLGLPQPVTSHHLGLLRRAGFIEADRRGKEVWYRVSDSKCLKILDCINSKG